MTLYGLMEKVEHYNKIAEILGNKKVYVRFDGFERFTNRKEAINHIERNYLNRVEILGSEMLQTDKRNEFTVADDGFTYEVILFNEY